MLRIEIHCINPILNGQFCKDLSDINDSSDNRATTGVSSSICRSNRSN